MDFWKTQTAMHHSLENQGERGEGFGMKPKGEWFQREMEGDWKKNGQRGSKKNV